MINYLVIKDRILFCEQNIKNNICNNKKDHLNSKMTKELVI